MRKEEGVSVSRDLRQPKVRERTKGKKERMSKRGNEVQERAGEREPGYQCTGKTSNKNALNSQNILVWFRFDFRDQRTPSQSYV